MAPLDELVGYLAAISNFLALFGFSIFAILLWIMSVLRKRKQQRKKTTFESSMFELERSVADLTKRDFEIQPDELPVRVVPSPAEQGIRTAPEPEGMKQRVSRTLYRKKPKFKQTILLHVQDYEIETGQPSPQTQEDIIKWTIVANLQRKSRDYFPADIADAIVKRKTEEYSFELANKGKVSQGCIDVAEHEDVDPRTYRRISILDNQEIAKVQRAVQEVMKGGSAHIHEARERSRHCLDEVFKDAVKRKVTETQDKIKKTPRGYTRRQLPLINGLISRAQERIGTDPETALEYADRAEDILKTTLDDIRQTLRNRAKDLRPRQRRETSEIDWSEATLGKAANVGRYSKPELDRIKAKCGRLSQSDVSELRYRFGVILAYVYNFPGSTPNEIAEASTLLPSTVAGEIHFLERLGYVRPLIRKDRKPRLCYPKIDISTLRTEATAFIGKHVLILGESIYKSERDGRKFYSLSDNGVSLYVLSSQGVTELMEKKIIERKFALGRFREATDEERSFLHDEFVIDIDDSAAIAIGEAAGFETGKQQLLETYISPEG